MDPAFLYLWLLAFIRASGLMALFPVFSGHNIPIPVRLAIAAFLAYAGSLTMHGSVAQAPDLGTLVVAATHELIIGLLMGLGVRLIFYAVEMAGQIMANEIGLMVSAQIDPVSQNSSSPVGVALTMFTTLLFLISGSHHACIAAFVRSFSLATPGMTEFHRSVGEVFVQTTGNLFLYALQMAAPLLAMNFVITLTFAILSKAAPGVNAFSESFAVRITAGLTLLALSLGLTAQLVLSQLRQSPELMLRLIP